MPLPAVSARLGHGSIRTTQEIYSHMIHGQDDLAAEEWEKFQNQGAGVARQGRVPDTAPTSAPASIPQKQCACRSNRVRLLICSNYKARALD